MTPQKPEMPERSPKRATETTQDYLDRLNYERGFRAALAVPEGAVDLDAALLAQVLPQWIGTFRPNEVRLAAEAIALEYRAARLQAPPEPGGTDAG